MASIFPPDPLSRSLMISETRWDVSCWSLLCQQTHIHMETLAHHYTQHNRKLIIIKVVRTWTLIFCTWVMDYSSSYFILDYLTTAGPISHSRGLQCKLERGYIFRGSVGRQVPQLQTSTVCLLIRSLGCHSIHHLTARHTAPLSRILQLQSGFHTHPLMTKPDTGTDSSSSVGFQWQEIWGGWYPPVSICQSTHVKTTPTDKLYSI